MSIFNIKKSCIPLNPNNLKQLSSFCNTVDVEDRQKVEAHVQANWKYVAQHFSPQQESQ